MLGLYVSDHPLLGAEAALRRKSDGTLADLRRARRRRRSAPSAASSPASSASGPARATSWPCSPWRTSRAPIEVMVFPKTMTDHGHKLADDAVVVVRGRVDKREDQPKLIAMDVEPFEPMAGEAFPLRVKVASAALSEAVIDELKRLLAEHPGDSAGVPPPRRAAGAAAARGVDRRRRPGLLAELRVLLGPTAILV